MRATLRCSAMLILLQFANATSALAGEVVQVKISDLAFLPADITVKVGDTVEWLNGDFIDHTATAKNGDWDVMVIAEKSARLQLTHAGTIDYFCRVHPGMTGTIHIVAE
ncbi:cupredoxin domain-containing protein [Hyphomicrobium facile]|uniref:Plastocyanin n=1 Tax=Hyphomicrobium facile TaxID=51670 RepID=A0A1I7MTR0_9HYPH|nr:cupredoxin domain-containing protein [Hyphomicrobium facile]SFV25785.1 Plastocyanin [Hyphomicrobium facile]